MRAFFLALSTILLAGCEREHRDFRELPPGASPGGTVRHTEFVAGPGTRDPSFTVYERNAWAIGEGERLYGWFNCAGCHGMAGGGGIGPPLLDDAWIYGGSPENLFRTIQEGRPNGMPSYEGRLSAADTWKLVAYLRTLSAQTARDTWPGRRDHMVEGTPAVSRGPGLESADVQADRERREQRR